MSDARTFEHPAATRPASPGSDQVTDSLGRVLTVKRLDALRELDLIEAAGGQNADNRRWMMMATLAACVIAIDGTPRPFPKDRKFIREHVAAVGSEGIEAVLGWLAPEERVAAEAESDDMAMAKN